MNDTEKLRTDELGIVTKLLPQLAELADGNFIDRTLRPKSKRVKFTAKSYTEMMEENIAHWKKEPIDDYMRKCHGVGEMALNAVQQHFELYLQVYNLLNQRIDRDLEAEDAAKKARRRQLREEQRDMDVFDPKRKCLSCGLYIFMYDETNNRRHDKAEVCKCNASRSIQNQMKVRISEYRQGLKEKKLIPKKDPGRYDK